MKCLMLQEHGRLILVDAPLPKPEADEVLVAVRVCGICGSDVHGMDGSTGRRIPPIIMGHEAAGVIAEVGSEVNGWSTGTRVTFDSTVFCGRCESCRRGKINLCDARQVLGVSCAEYRRPGAFAEYVAVPQRILHELPENVSFVQAAMVEPVSVALHAVRRTPIQLNDRVVVVGAGMIGLLVIQILRACGAGRICAVDLDDHRLGIAAESGADVCLRADQTGLVEALKGHTGGKGADCAFEVVGISSALATALSSVRKGGVVTVIGNLSPTVEFGLQELVTREVTVYGSCASAGEYPACLDFIARRIVRVEPLISAVAPLSEGARWFDRLYNRERGLMKVILCPTGETR